MTPAIVAGPTAEAGWQRLRRSVTVEAGLLVAVLFAVLLNLRASDATIGDAGQLTLVTNIHLVTLALIVVLASVALRDRRRAERDLPVRHPDWPMLIGVGGLYVLIIGAMVLRAALF